MVENNLTKDNVYVRDEKKQSIPVSFAKVDSKTVEVNVLKRDMIRAIPILLLYINKNLDKTSSLYKEDTKSKEYSIQFTVK
ncbi:hypothetical protein F6Y02_00400 [Bacillus megaterium]|nr:hypothetical protein [Priestia megaterium]